MKAQGKVINVIDNRAIVVSKRSSACASCKNCENKGMCHAELVFGGDNYDSVEISVINDIGASVGDTVEIEASSEKTLFVSAIVFVMPIVLTAIFAVWSQAFFKSMITFSIASALVFLLSFVFLAKLMNNYTKRKVISRIVKILEESGDSFERE